MLRELLRDRRWRWGLSAAGVLAGVAFLYSVRAVFPPFFLAVVIAYALHPLVDALNRRGLGRSWSILIVYALVGLLVGAGLAFVVPVLVGQMGELAGTLPDYVARLGDALAGVERRYERLALPPALRQTLDDNVRRLEASTLKAIGAAVQSLIALFGQAFTLILAPILAFYMMHDLPRFRRQVELWLPAGSRGQARTFVREMDRVLAGFVRGQMLVAALVGLLTTVAMGFLGVPFPLVLGLIAALTDLIPYFGPFLGAIPGLALAGLVSFGLALKAAAVYALVQQLEAAVLVPRIVGGTVGLHPLVLAFALLVGGTYLGLGGLILAVPVAGLLRVTLSFLGRWLAGDPPEDV